MRGGVLWVAWCFHHRTLEWSQTLIFLWHYPVRCSSASSGRCCLRTSYSHLICCCSWSVFTPHLSLSSICHALKTATNNFYGATAIDAGMGLESLTQQSSQEWKHECQWYDAISCSCTNEFSRLLCVSPGRRPVIFIFSCLGFLDNFKRGGRHYDWRDTISSRRWNSAYCEWIRLVHPWYLCKVPDILHVSLAVVYQLYNRG